MLRVRIDGRLVQLEALLVRLKSASGRLPVALITHGQSPNQESRSATRATDYRFQARDLALRGWLAAVVIRRGFGQSDGPRLDKLSCGNPKAGEQWVESARDLMAALEEIRRRPDAAPDIAIAIGASTGGVAALALAAAQPTGLKGVINISGGERMLDCLPISETAMVSAITELAPRVKVPSLWVYAANDSYFGPKLVDRMHEAGLAEGMTVRRVALGAMGSDGHIIFRHFPGRRAWLRELDASLRGWRLPSWRLDLVVETARHLPFDLTKALRNRSELEVYFSAGTPKVLIWSPPTRSLYFRTDGGNYRANEIEALADCSKAGRTDCRVAMRDHHFIKVTSGPN